MKQRVVAAARRAGVLPVLEWAHYLRASARSRADNRRFLSEKPDFHQPPSWWMHDMYAHTSLRQYDESGRRHAAGIEERIMAALPAGDLSVAEWGCGLGRVIRHLPDSWRRHGFDYNTEAIAWCAQHLPGIVFAHNGALPPLPAPDASFDAIYALSVLTHLSEPSQHAWISELTRVLKPGGVLIATVHGDGQTGTLLPREAARFASGEVVVRDRVKEGGRTFTAWHSEASVRRLLTGFDVLEGPTPAFGQTLWMARKPK